MKIIINVQLLFIILILTGCSGDDYSSPPDVIQSSINQKVIKVRVEGEAYAETKFTIDPETGQNNYFSCFTVDLIDELSGEKVGTFQECNINQITTQGGVLMMNSKATFSINGKGSITSENKMIVLLSEKGIVKFSLSPSNNNIIRGRGSFGNISGRVYGEGEVDFSRLSEGIAQFNSGYQIRID